MTKSESRLLSSAVAGLLFGAPTAKLAAAPATEVVTDATPAEKGANQNDDREEP